MGEIFGNSGDSGKSGKSGIFSGNFLGIFWDFCSGKTSSNKRLADRQTSKTSKTSKTGQKRREKAKKSLRILTTPRLPRYRGESNYYHTTLLLLR